MVIDAVLNDDVRVAGEECLNRDALVASNPVGGVEVSGVELEITRRRLFREREFALGMGLSVSLHAVVLILVVLAMLLDGPRGIPETSFVTVCLVQGDGRGGPEGGRDAPAGDSVGESSPLGESSPSPGEVGCSPVAPTEWREVASSEWAAPSLLAPQPDEVATIRPDPVADEARDPAPVPVMTRPVRKRPRERRVVRERTPVPEKSARVSGPRTSGGARHGLVPLNESASVGDAVAKWVVPGDKAGGGAGEGAQNSRRGGDGLASAGGMGAVPPALELTQVDTPPVVREKVEPEFPLAARRSSVTGRVVVRFLVKIDGTVGKAFVTEADPGGIFEENALDAVKRWKFTPGRYRGNAVATWVVLPIRFRLTR